MAVPLARTAPRRGLVAAASQATYGPSGSAISKRRQESWQKQAFFYVKAIPELNYASRFYAKMLSKLRLFPAYRQPNDELVPISEGLPVELLDRIQDPGGGRSQILWMYGRLMFIIGEGYLFGHDLGTVEEAWAFVNPEELEYDGNEILWKPEKGKKPKRYARGTKAQAYRMWTPDPEFSGEAESPMRAVIDLGEEIDLLSKSVKSTAVSRLINGMYKVPSELSFGSDEPGLDGDAEANPFLRRMFEHMLGVVENAGSPEAALGFFAEGAYEFLDRLEHVDLHNTDNDYLEQNLRKEAIDRAGMGLDMPLEDLKGMGEANHWGARQIIHDRWMSHGSVLAEQCCDDFADAYLRRALREQKFERWREVVIGYDDSNVSVPPDRTDDADKADDRGRVNDLGYRRMKGIPDSYKASEEDQRVHLAIKLRDVRLLKGTKFEVEDQVPQVPQGAQGPMEPGPQPRADESQPAEETPPDPGPAGVSRRESRTSAVQGAAWTALYRCRELAGSRIQTQHRRLPEFVQHGETCASLRGDDYRCTCHKSAPRADLASSLGEERLKKLGSGKAVDLVTGGTEVFAVYLTDELGFTDAQAQALSEMLLVHAARTLYDRRAPFLPSGFLAEFERMQDASSMLSEHALVQRNNEALAEVERQIKRGGGPRAITNPRAG